MTPFETTVVKTLRTGLMGDSIPSVSDAQLLAGDATDLLKASLTLLPNVTYEPYAVCTGHKIETRVRVKGKRIKPTTVSPGWDNSSQRHCLQAITVAYAVTESAARKGPLVFVIAGDPTFDLNNARRETVSCVMREIVRLRGTAIQATLDTLVPDRASQLRAQNQLMANRNRSNDTKKKFAMERLTETMRSFDFAREDVLEAWEISQVRGVHES
jgi:hypothetical protein